MCATKVTLRAAGLAILGATLAVVVQLAEVACNDVGAGTVPINTRVSRVASVMAEAVAEVVVECTGQGNAVVTANGFANAAATAEAVGNASASIITTSGICEFCSVGLEAFASAVETVAVTAVAEASAMADFMFQEGIVETLTAQDIQRDLEVDIIQVLASVVGMMRTDPDDGCSANVDILAMSGGMVATCDVAVSADDIRTEIDAVAASGAAVRAIACDGGSASNNITILSREVATAVAQAIVQVDAFCESTGGPGTRSCALGNGTVTAVARATARAFASGLVQAGDDGCTCDLDAMVDAEDMTEIIAAATTSAMVRVCTDGAESVIDSDFQIAVEELNAVAVAEFVAFAMADSNCMATIRGCADAAQCVRDGQQCSGPGVEQQLPCCDANLVCASVFGSETFTCRSRASANAFAAEVLEC